jgi:hypothetical protein
MTEYSVQNEKERETLTLSLYSKNQIGEINDMKETMKNI